MENNDVIAEDVPKFQELLQNITLIASDIFPLISKLNEQVDKGDITVVNGVSLLDVKNNSLLTYLLDIVTIMLNKINGLSLSENDAVSRTVEFRTVLEKLRPLEQKLKYQIDKAIQASATDIAAADNDPLQFKPNLENFEDSDDDEGEDETLPEDKKYVPPHIAATQHEEEDKRLAKLEKAKRDALTKSSLIAELVEESSDLPTEHSHRTLINNKSSKLQEERTRYEEAYYTRLNLPKRQRGLEKKMLQKSELDTIANFGSLDVFQEINPSTSKGAGKKRKKQALKKHGKSKRKKR